MFDDQMMAPAPSRSTWLRGLRVSVAAWLLACAAVAGAQGFSGTYTLDTPQGPVRLSLVEDGAGNVRGTLEGNGSRFDLEGVVDDVDPSVAYGTVVGPQGTLVFEVTLYGPQDAVLVLASLLPDGSIDVDGASQFAFQRDASVGTVAPNPPGAAGAPGAAPAAPGGTKAPGGALGAATPTTPTGAADTSRVLATGAYGTLTEDAASAFVEALVFSLQQVGYAYQVSPEEQAQLMQLLAQNYATLSPDEQVILGRARQIWSEAQASWPSASDPDRRAFVLAVFTLAFGEEAVQQAAGGGAGGGGGGGCASFEDCAGAYMDGSTYQDAQNAQSCWAAAGCGGYDAANDSFYDPTGAPMD
ncbi:MAG: hypothetical protein R6W77_10645 [Trueperaceae bacterium]